MPFDGLHFGAFFPQGWRRELAGLGDARQQWEQAVDVALLAERLGYDSLWVFDHFHNVPEPSNESIFECWTTMAALSQVTERIRLGQMVSCAGYRNPALVAKITSNVDVMSGGRLEWGIGAGWYWSEYEAYGWEMPGNRDRLKILEETVRIVHGMWAEPTFSFDGEFAVVSGAQCDPKPLQQPKPPTWIGGGGEQITLRVVARLADRSNFGGKPDEWAHKAEVLKDHCRDVGRDYDEIDKTWMPEVFIRETEAEVAAAGTQSMWNEPFDSWQAGNLVGTPEQVADKIRTYADLGCTGFVPWCADYPGTETLTRFAEQVIPELR